MQLNSRNVSRLSFLVMTVVAVITGLAGNWLVVRSLEDQFLSHGVAHSREVAINLRTMLHDLLRREADPAQALEGFQVLLDEDLHRQNGYVIALLEAGDARVLASSEPGQLAPGGLPQGLQTVRDRWLHASEATRPQRPWFVSEDPISGQVLLTYLTPVSHEGAAHTSAWQLVVRSDITDLMETMHTMHTRLSAVLLATVVLMAVWGFWVMRHIGRTYEAHLEGELAERTAQLEATHREMLHKARLATLGQTASMLAHEIRTPLASMRLGLSDLLAGNRLQGRDARRLQLLLREVVRLDDLLSQTLDYVRPVRPGEHPKALDELLDEVLPWVEPALRERGIILERSACRDCPGLRMDVNQMKQVLLNLLNNAIEASPTAGRIQLALNRREQWLCLRIANQGNPIPARDLPRLFEPFYTTKARGNGLGLVLVKRVVEEHGGRVTVHSAAGTGTCFIVELPVAISPGSAAKPASAATAPVHERVALHG